jgi:hypothetical protein
MQNFLAVLTILGTFISLRALLSTANAQTVAPNPQPNQPPVLPPNCPPFPACPASPAPSPYSAGFLRITDSGLCAMPPGLIATDGCDDVCTLATCCDGWTTNTGGPVELPNGVMVDCSTVNCGNVCRMACDRTGTSAACDALTPCGAPSQGLAYVFMRSVLR